MSHRPTADRHATGRPLARRTHPRGLGSVRFARDGADRELPPLALDADTLPNFSGTAQCSQALPLHFCERFR